MSTVNVKYYNTKYISNQPIHLTRSLGDDHLISSRSSLNFKRSPVRLSLLVSRDRVLGLAEALSPSRRSCLPGRQTSEKAGVSTPLLPGRGSRRAQEPSRCQVPADRSFKTSRVSAEQTADNLCSCLAGSSSRQSRTPRKHLVASTWNAELCSSPDKEPKEAGCGFFFFAKQLGKDGVA